jgi:hypothetical protein
MPQQTILERFTEPLFVLLDETFENVHGMYLDKGTSLLTTLDGVSASEASRPPAKGCATIASQARHVRFYLTVLLRSIRGEDIGTPDWKEIWRSTGEVTPAEWDALRRDLKETYQSVRAMLRGFETWEGEEDISGSLSIVVHTAYHLGSIRQALAVLRGV